MNFTVYSTNAYNLFVDPLALILIGTSFNVEVFILEDIVVSLPRRAIVDVVSLGCGLEETGALFDGDKTASPAHPWHNSNPFGCLANETSDAQDQFFLQKQCALQQPYL
ncbi:uncharacterized protein BJ212DRAFT_1304783 [Suillus subaureus]|uniref:Uncharacterized protein n=1 Tax=Suillus subaureus TaxID=48587 RepID=A0A9P7DTH6_9AGAM|nr:uncharacterized protein BJ212DRAFT_1304783 [Suillus subaureus]KAG1802559.1 hypothetical protein BJ212DRAFT_1304783 [Suillus subaureus]